MQHTLSQFSLTVAITTNLLQVVFDTGIKNCQLVPTWPHKNDEDLLNASSTVASELNLNYGIFLFRFVQFSLRTEDN